MSVKTRLNIELPHQTMQILDALVARRPGQTRTSTIAMVIHDAFDALSTIERKRIEDRWKTEENEARAAATPHGAFARQHGLNEAAIFRKYDNQDRLTEIEQQYIALIPKTFVDND